MRQVGISWLLDDYLWIQYDAGTYFVRDLKRLKRGEEVDLLLLSPPSPPAVGYAKLFGHTIQIDYNAVHYTISSAVLDGKKRPFLRCNA